MVDTNSCKVENVIKQNTECTQLNENDQIQEFHAENFIKRPDTPFFYFTMLTGILNWLVGGTTLAWASPAVVKFKSNDSDVNPLGRPITTGEISVLAGVPMIVALVGTIALPALADWIGRKKSMQIMGLSMFLSIIGTAFSNQVELYMVFLSSASVFFFGLSSVLPIYLTEVCEKHNRAKFGCLLAVCVPFGQLYTYVVGPPFSIRTFTLLTAAPLIPFLLFFFFAPESPTYSLMKGQKEECIRSLEKLRSNKSTAELEIDFKIIEQNLLATNGKNTNSITTLFRLKEGRIGVMLALLLIILQYVSGGPVIMVLLAPIFNESGSNLSGNTIAIFVGSLKVVTYIFTSFIIEKTGRKPLLLISCAGTSISISILGIFFYLKYINSPIVYQFQWVPLACILIFIFSYSLGLGPIPNALFAELFSSDLIAIASVVVLTVSYLVLGCYVTAYPLVAEAIGTHWCMWIFGLSNFIGGFLVYFVVPETNGKSVQEIQDMLKKY